MTQLKIALQKFVKLILGAFIIANFVVMAQVSRAAAPTDETSTPSGPPKPIVGSISSKNGTLSFDFQDIEIRTLLQLIAKNSNMNFIISDTVKGNITLSLKDVTWQRALDIILKSRGLTARQVGNIIMISTIEEITSNESKQLQSDETLANLGPLTSKIVPLKYALAKDVAALLKGSQSQLLTPRGQVAVDTPTNSLIIRDTSSSVKTIVKEIQQLDVPAKQVLIEARIVTIDVNYVKDIGARFGISHSRWLSGTFTGANSLAQMGSLPPPTGPAFVTGTGTNTSIDPTQRLNFNIPSIGAFGATPGSIGIAVANIGGVSLDLELSALEGENHAELLSSPRVMTSNQQKATIQMGEEIPYQEASSSGATSVSFKNAVLSLEITPQITPDNKIVLYVKATQDSRGTDTQLSATAGATATSVPSINTQEVDSNIIINNNETVVLGGIYKQTKNHTYERIPFLGSLPFIGPLFTHTADNDEKEELLVFITPKIIGLNKVPPTALRGEE